MNEQESADLIRKINTAIDALPDFAQCDNTLDEVREALNTAVRFAERYDERFA